jgi:hypothetical protein
MDLIKTIDNSNKSHLRKASKENYKLNSEMQTNVDGVKV